VLEILSTSNWEMATTDENSKKFVKLVNVAKHIYRRGEASPYAPQGQR